jgi:MOSC domain-containing protein YiiM
MKNFVVKSVNTSAEKGILKNPVEFIELNETGIVGDVHAGKWHRQVSLLAYESIKKAELVSGIKFPFGAFAENITTSGIEINKAGILDRFENENIILEVTQIGKKCHNKCEIGRQMGNCIMPAEGIFCRVIKGGIIYPGDIIMWKKKIFQVKIIALVDSDKDDFSNYFQLIKIVQKIRTFFNDIDRDVNIKTEIVQNSAHKFVKTIENIISGDMDVIVTSDFSCKSVNNILAKKIHDYFKACYTDIIEMLFIKNHQNNSNNYLNCGSIGALNKIVLFNLPIHPDSIDKCINEVFTKFHKSISF